MCLQRDIAKICDRRKKRKHFHIQIPKHLKELDNWLKQDFKVGSKVKVKFRGDKGKPSWPAEVATIEHDSFQIKWTNASKIPHGQKIGDTYKVHNERHGPKQQYRYKRISGAARVSNCRLSRNERYRLTSAIECMKAGRMPGSEDKTSFNSLNHTESQVVCEKIIAFSTSKPITCR